MTLQYVPSAGALSQRIRQSHIAHGVEVATGGHTESIGNVSFSAVGGSKNDDIAVLIDVIAGTEAGDERLAQLSVGIKYLHISTKSAGDRQQVSKMPRLNYFPISKASLRNLLAFSGALSAKGFYSAAYSHRNGQDCGEEAGGYRK